MKPLFKHQKEALDFIVSNNGFGALFHEVGCGKTRTALEIFSHYKRLDPELKLFVICPLSLINSAWGEDIKQFTCFNYRNCHDETIELRKDTDIYIINFESLISENKIKQLHKMINFSKVMCVIDESSKMKNHKARTTKTLLSLRNYFNFRIIMSGTPAPNCETEYWAQINFIKPGIVHEKFYPFRYFYFHLERERNGKQEFTSGQIYSKLAAQQMFQRGWHYDITTQKRQLLMDKISPYCHYARKAECLDLPEQMDEVRLVDMGKKQASVYNSMKRDLIAEIQNSFVVAQVALAKIMKLRQITSGFAIDESGETIIIGENPKLQELKDVLEEAGKQQVIIWCQFQHEIRQIKDLLGDKAVTLYGETKDKDDSITAFKNGSAQYLIAHPKSAGHGLTFVNCSLQVFYSLDYSWELYEQARGRIHRAGQVNKCTYVHLLCKGTIDEEILNVLRNKKDATEILYRMVQGNLAEVGK